MTIYNNVVTLSLQTRLPVSKEPYREIAAPYWLVTGEFPAQKASDAENVSIWWRHHVLIR